MRYEINYLGKKYELFIFSCKKCKTNQSVGLAPRGTCFSCLSEYTLNKFKNKYPTKLFEMTNEQLLKLINDNKYVSIKRWRDSKKYIWLNVGEI